MILAMYNTKESKNPIEARNKNKICKLKNISHMSFKAIEEYIKVCDNALDYSLSNVHKDNNYEYVLLDSSGVPCIFYMYGQGFQSI